MNITLSPMHGHAAPEQPANYVTQITPTFLDRLIAPKHRDCGGKYLPRQRRGSFLLRTCSRCGKTVRYFV